MGHSEVKLRIKGFWGGSLGQCGDVCPLLWVRRVGAAAPSHGCGIRAWGSSSPSIYLLMGITGSKPTLPKAQLTPERFKAPNLSFLPPTREKPRDVMGLRRL